MSTDAMFVLNVIRDNEHWNTLGVTESDISVCFEMSHLGDYGATFKRSRFKEALHELEESAYVVQRGNRWFWYDSKGLEHIDERGARLCERPGCGKDISHLRANAAFCGPDCRNRANNAHRRAK